MRLFISGIVLLLCAGVNNLLGQSLPPAMQLSPDGRMILTGKSAPTGLYDSAAVRNIYLYFTQPNYWSLLTGNYQTHTDLPARMVVDDVTYDSVGVRFKGQTSYSQTQNSQKKSFNISTDYIHEDQRLMGYKTLNLNNCFQDPSFLREVFYLHQSRNHIPVAKANFVQLHINDQPWGLYPNIQQLNKDFLEQWFLSNDGANWRADRPDGAIGGPGGPGWGDGTAAINYLGADTALYQPHYTLKSSDIDNPWDYLVATCDALNNTPAAELPEVLPNYLDIDRTLWFLATEIAFSDDDSYIFKGRMDYYVYYEPETGRMTPLEYDGNSVMKNNASSWSPFYNANNANYPLLNRILAQPMWRQRYLAHLRTVIDEELNPATAFPILDHYKSMIDTMVQADPKKLYTYNQFVSEVTQLKNFITNRRNYLLAQAEVAAVAPTLQEAAYTNVQGQAWTPPAAGEPIQITVRAAGANGLFRVNLFYATGLVGNFTPLAMFDDGQHGDGEAADGLYGITLAGQQAGEWVRFYFEAVSNNTARTAAYLPVGAEHDIFIFRVQAGGSGGGPIVINELMADNSATVSDEAGDYEDWFELYNTTSEAIDLGGYFLSDKADNPAKYEIPEGVILPANGYLVFWADEDGSEGPLHANFKLSTGGELITLYSPVLELVDSVEFGAQQTDVSYARSPNGAGPFVFQAATFGANNDITATEDQPIAESALSLAPNPARDAVYVNLKGLTGGHWPLVVYDVNGRRMHQQTINGQRTIIYTSGWANGVYVISYGPYTQKLIVNH